MERIDIDNMSPDDRTIMVLTGLDQMLSQLDATISTESLSADQIDSVLVDKISNSLRWITGNLDIQHVEKLISDDRNHFENGPVIRELLHERTFNVNKYN